MVFGKKSAFDRLIVGLGNPGLIYEKTRHNAGFMAVDRLAEQYGAVLNKNRMNAVFGEGRIEDERVLIAKPQTYMNLSGAAVAAISGFYKIPADRILILFDDISLDVGKIRMRRKGSHGGHNGMKDIIEQMGTDQLARIKIGVGAKPSPETDLKDWVLGKIPAELETEWNRALDKAVDAVTEIIAHGLDSAMNRYNS